MCTVATEFLMSQRDYVSLFPLSSSLKLTPSHNFCFFFFFFKIIFCKTLTLFQECIHTPLIFCSSLYDAEAKKEGNDEKIDEDEPGEEASE